MRLAFTTSTRASVHGQLKLARLFTMSERDFEARIRDLEGDAVFRRLVDFGVLSIQPYPNRRFGRRRFGGLELRASGNGLAEVLEGRGDLVSLIARIGQAPFEDCFLNDNDLSDEERAARCGVSCADAVRLRDLVDRLYVRSEIAGAPAAAPAVPTYSPVAGIEIEDGKAVIAFFNREIWKGRYRVDDQRRDGFLGSMDRKDAMAAARLLGELEHIERRKATLYRLLEILVEAQARYLISGKPEDRKALTQRTVSEKLDTIPSVLNRLISNKSVQLPWGLEAPLKVFMPSRKLLARDNLHDIVVTRPGLSDEALGREMKRVYGWRLSRRSITQYRHELGLAAAYGR